ncbi:hypothetical protein ACEPAF_5436 [Sanghuangporus sanghuang]
MSFIPSSPHGYVPVPHKLAAQATVMPTMAPPSVESMFEKIMETVQKSHSEISELRQQCAELRIANANLERLMKDSQMNGHANGYLHHYGSSAYHSPQNSPKPRNKSPFLTALPNHRIPSPPLLCVPSSLGDRAFTFHHTPEREIPGFYVVIPAGGAGTRLWPLSRENHPKFLLDVNLCGRSLLQRTWDRLVPLSSPARTTVVAGPSHAESIRDQLPELVSHNLFIEPGAKDSMAAIGLAAAILVRRDPEAVIGSFAADHMVSGTDAFLSAVAEAVEVARTEPGYLVTIGIAPSNPATGFGYVRLGESLHLPNAPNARLVGSFKEKPDARTAASYLATGNYRWNAGMFVTRAAFLMELLRVYKPELYDGLSRIAELWDSPSPQSAGGEATPGGVQEERRREIEEIWEGLEKIAIDHAVAEPAAAEGRVAVIPATFGWDDVGDFSSLSEMIPAEANQPKVLGDHSLVLTEQVVGGIVIPGSGRLVACLGVDDLVIVDMPDALMVTTRARSQEVKRLVKRAKETGWKGLL